VTPEQYERWKDFALRMARTCWQGQRRPDTEWIVEKVEEFFEAYYPDADEAEDVKSWDHTEGKGVYGVGDNMSDFAHEQRERPGYWTIKDSDTDRIRAYKKRLVARGLSDEDVEAKVAKFEERLDESFDDREDQAFEQWDDQWMGPVRCCIRAGLDTAATPSGGVVGFTVGDLRRMYPDGLPNWIHDAYEGKLREAADTDGVWL
jgi:hypothetical protein